MLVYIAKSRFTKFLTASMPTNRKHVCKTLQIRIINNLTPEDYYSRLPYIEYNYQVAMEDTFRNKLSSFLDQVKLTNNL